MTAEAGGRDVLALDVSLGDEWTAVPLTDVDGDAWANGVCGRLLPHGGPAGESLEFQLGRVRENLREMKISGLTAAVWIPVPESGLASGTLGFRLGGRAPEDTPDALLTVMEQDRDVVTADGTRFLEVQPWGGRVEAGEFAAVRHLLSHNDQDGDEGWVEERVLYVVFPDGAAQTVELFFSAENLGSFEDIAAQTQEIVATLTVNYEHQS